MQCTVYTWYLVYNDRETLANTCFLMSTCQAMKLGCVGCITGPPPVTRVLSPSSQQTRLEACDSSSELTTCVQLRGRGWIWIAHTTYSRSVSSYPPQLFGKDSPFKVMIPGSAGDWRPA